MHSVDLEVADLQPGVLSGWPAGREAQAEKFHSTEEQRSESGCLGSWNLWTRKPGGSCTEKELQKSTQQFSYLQPNTILMHKVAQWSLTEKSYWDATSLWYVLDFPLCRETVSLTISSEETLLDAFHGEPARLGSQLRAALDLIQQSFVKSPKEIPLISQSVTSRHNKIDIPSRKNNIQTLKNGAFPMSSIQFKNYQIFTFKKSKRCYP